MCEWLEGESVSEGREEGKGRMGSGESARFSKDRAKNLKVIMTNYDL